MIFDPWPSRWPIKVIGKNGTKNKVGTGDLGGPSWVRLTIDLLVGGAGKKQDFRPMTLTMTHQGLKKNGSKNKSGPGDQERPTLLLFFAQGMWNLNKETGNRNLHWSKWNWKKKMENGISKQLHRPQFNWPGQFLVTYNINKSRPCHNRPAPNMQVVSALRVRFVYSRLKVANFDPWSSILCTCTCIFAIRHHSLQSVKSGSL